MAGVEGFEPSNAGIKIRCLRPAWRYPCPRVIQSGNQSKSGCSARLRVTRTRHRPGNDFAEKSTSESPGSTAKTALPEPVIRGLSPSDVKFDFASEIAKQSDSATCSRSLCPGKAGHDDRTRSEKNAILWEGEFLVKLGDPKIFFVDTLSPGQAII